MTSQGTKMRACTGKRAHQRQCDATSHLRHLEGYSADCEEV
jgi:hypothetical protein